MHFSASEIVDLTLSDDEFKDSLGDAISKRKSISAFKKSNELVNKFNVTNPSTKSILNVETSNLIMSHNTQVVKSEDMDLDSLPSPSKLVEYIFGNKSDTAKVRSFFNDV